MYVDLSILSGLVPYLPVLLPIVVTFVAGILRQDGLPDKVNQGITFALVVIAAIVVALYNHALTPNAALDLVVILGYTTTIMRLPALQSMQQWLQSNWVNLILSDAAKLAQAAASSTSSTQGSGWQRQSPIVQLPADQMAAAQAFYQQPAPLQAPQTYTTIDYSNMPSQVPSIAAPFVQQQQQAQQIYDATNNVVNQPTVTGVPAVNPGQAQSPVQMAPSSQYPYAPGQAPRG